jgi:hypothetical protein
VPRDPTPQPSRLLLLLMSTTMPSLVAEEVTELSLQYFEPVECITDPAQAAVASDRDVRGAGTISKDDGGQIR